MRGWKMIFVPQPIPTDEEINTQELGFKTPFIPNLEQTGGVFQSSPSVCNHFEYCNIAKISGRNCADYENCQTFKFRTKYPNYQEMFVGSKLW